VPGFNFSTIPLMSNDFSNMVVFGANGAIGAAFCRQLAALHPQAALHAFSRSPVSVEYANVHYHVLDYEHEAALQQAAASVATHGAVDMVVVASGLLHDECCKPEKALRELNSRCLLRLYAVNAVLPLLIAKHFVPLLKRSQRSLFVAMSAHAGSISQNRLGGWYAYRAAKAALNMLLKNLAIETARSNKQAVIAGLHPGIVDSKLSKPFQALFDKQSIFSADYAVEQLLQLLDKLDSSHSGKIFCWDGSELEA